MANRLRLVVHERALWSESADADRDKWTRELEKYRSLSRGRWARLPLFVILLNDGSTPWLMQLMSMRELEKGCPDGTQTVIGIGKSKSEATELVRRIVECVFREEGCLDLKAYFKAGEKGGGKGGG